MNLFFGKISKNFDAQQIEDGYYISPKGSSWFGNLKIGDYVYLIGGDRIQLWKAKEWGTRNDQECLNFEIIFKKTKLKIKDLVAFKYFYLDMNLVVKSTRSTASEKKAFFEIGYDNELTEKMILNEDTYSKSENFRIIKTFLQDQKTESNSYNIQLQFVNGKLNMLPIENCDPKFIERFTDNLAFIGRGSSRKDKTLTIVKDIKNIGKPLDITISNFFDAFLCEYNESEDFENKPKEDLSNLNSSNESKTMNQPLNQILYGPPGTGKTYATKELAVKIANPGFLVATTLDEAEQRQEISKEYQRLFDAGQIVFTTFHQSMSYEDFVEGIKPVLDSEETDDATDEKEGLKYEIQDGIFKSISNLATGVSGNIERTTEIDFGSKDFYKMSLGGKHRPEEHKWSIKNNLIFLGWGGDKNFTALKGIKDWKSFRDKFKQDYPELVSESKYVIQAVFIFQNMKVGDIVFITKGNNIIDAIGVITGDYFYDDSKEIDNYQFRNVKWLATDLNASPDVFIRKKISQQTIYEFYNNDVKIEVLDDYFNSSDLGNAPEKKYVLIIDEINRGNVSSIFGELITLLEADKRIGASDEIRLKLPYSKTEFGVPSNLYIIGTMNTADRSVEALDTALRRRFSFVEVMPNHDILDREVEGFNLKNILETINNRVEALLDRDHTIGHSYFIKVDDKASLVHAFKNCIIPLLQEYFYGDYEKINLVLGDGFIYKDQKNTVTFAGNNFNSGYGSTERYIFPELTEENIDSAIRKLLNIKEAAQTDEPENK